MKRIILKSISLFSLMVALVFSMGINKAHAQTYSGTYNIPTLTTSPTAPIVTPTDIVATNTIAATNSSGVTTLPETGAIFYPSVIFIASLVFVFVALLY